MTNTAAIRITGILLGFFLFVIFMGYLIVSFSKGKTSDRIGGIRKFAGLFSLSTGILMIGAWIYWMISGWVSFQAQAFKLLLHVLTELGAAIMIFVAGIAMLRNWSRGPALFMLANGMLLLTTVLTLMAYGQSGHPLLMNGIAIVVTVISVFMVGLVYGWEHYVLRLDEPV